MFTVLVITVLLLCFVNHVTHSAPVNNRLTVKFYPISAKEDLTSKTFDAMFAKIPQDQPLNVKLKRETLREAHFPSTAELELGRTNQTPKVIYSFKTLDYNDTEMRESANNLNLPLVNQPFDKYKILVAFAPPMVKIGDKNKPLIIYIVFSEDRTNDLNPINIPTVYFVNKINDKMDKEQKVPVDPIFIIDSNRTVTGLKSKEISRYISFRNKLINLFENRLVP